MNIRIEKRCEVCHGTGVISGGRSDYYPTEEKCSNPLCNGRGWVACSDYRIVVEDKEEKK
jgi:DnaJ-class molecular chaperone